MTKWCVISDRLQAPRYQLLDEQLKAAGLETEFAFITADESTLPDVLKEAQATYDQIRVVGKIGCLVLPLLPRLPSSALSLKACDSLVKDGNEWWPRFFLVEGLNQTLASDAASLDLTGSVLVLGATPNARAVVAALSRVGFNKISISDPSEDACSTFVEELRRAYFGIQFQVVARDAVTQLPGVCSIAVNTLSQNEDSGSVAELAYFNFLKPQGFWLDLSIFPPNATLINEALSVGALVLSGARVMAAGDRLWAQSVFKTKIDFDAYIARLSAP